MIRKICFVVSCLVPLVSSAVEGKKMENVKTVCPMENLEVLQKATDKYLNFINKIGNGDVFPQMEAAAELISPNCKKILNGQLFTQNREDFVTDLLSIYENQGAWKVSPLDTVIAPSSNTVVVRILIEMDNFGAYTAIVIFRYDSSCLIAEINEVLNQVKGAYDFKDNK